MITGGTGTVGGRVLQLVADAGADVVVVSRRPAMTPPPANAEWVVHDVTADGLAPVLQPADRVLVHGFGDAHAMSDALATVEHVVLLSSLGAATRPRLYDFAAAYEAAVERSGVAATLLRPSGFMSNALAWAASIRAGGPAAAPYPDAALPVVDPRDVADAAATVLLAPARHAGRSYVLTGPVAISPREQVAVLADLLGRAVPLVELSRAQALAAMSDAMPAAVAEATLTLLGDPLPAERGLSADTVGVLGRSPRDWPTWAADHLDAFRPHPVQESGLVTGNAK